MSVMVDYESVTTAEDQQMSKKPFDSWSDLEGKSVDDLKAIFDEQNRMQGTVGREFIRDEIYHRRAAEQFKEMHVLTRTMTRLTWFLFGFTLINLIGGLIQVFRQH